MVDICKLFEQKLTDILMVLESELQIRCVKVILIDTSCAISSPNPMFDHLLEWSNIGFVEENGILEIEVCSLSGAL